MHQDPLVANNPVRLKEKSRMRQERNLQCRICDLSVCLQFLCFRLVHGCECISLSWQRLTRTDLPLSNLPFCLDWSFYTKLECCPTSDKAVNPFRAFIEKYRRLNEGCMKRVFFYIACVKVGTGELMWLRCLNTHTILVQLSSLQTFSCLLLTSGGGIYYNGTFGLKLSATVNWW